MFQPNFVIGTRPARQISENGLVASTVYTSSKHMCFMAFLKNSGQRRDWRRLAISWVVLGPFGVTLNRQIGLARATFKARRDTQPNVVISHNC